MPAPEEPVFPEPKLFVGQLLPAVTKDELIARFGQYGTVVQCTPLYHHDTGKFKGCAMVLFQKWAEAETAMENENGSYSLSGDRPMIVKFADPSRRADGVTAGITPKKLFVGQLAPGATEADVRAIFEPFGAIADVYMIRKGTTSTMGCAFVTFDRWAGAEAAIENVNAKVRMEGATADLVVRFADAKPVMVPRLGDKRGRDGMAYVAPGMGGMGMGGKRPVGMGGFDQSMGSSGGYGMGGGMGGGMGMGGVMGMGGMQGGMGGMQQGMGVGMQQGMAGMGMQNGMGGMQSGMGGGMGGGMGMQGGMQGGMGGMGMQQGMGGMQQAGYGMQQMQPSGYGVQSGMMGAGQGGQFGGMGMSNGMMGQQAPQMGVGPISSMPGPRPALQQGAAATGTQQQQWDGSAGTAGTAGYDQQQGGGQVVAASGQQDGSFQAGPQAGTASVPLDAEQLHLQAQALEQQKAELERQQQEFFQQQQQFQAQMAQQQQGMMGMGGGYNAGMGGGMGMAGGMGMGAGMGMQAGAMGGGMGGMGMQGGMGAGQMAGGVGAHQQRLTPAQRAALDAAKPWKLFIGQISFEMDVPDLKPYFDQYGTILELALLRLPDGRSRGCGFLTYTSREEAEAAIAALNEQTLPGDTRNRRIIVKYANQRDQ